jgi:S1-C subfamily serine protease
LAKQVGLEPLTKDGTIGFIISSVYADSPAEQIGIKSGDVLLRIKDQARDYPTELRAALLAQQRGGYSRWQYGGSGGANGAKVWKSRQNFLTEFLAAIGQDRTIEVTFCSRQGPAGWKSFTKEVKVQPAPLDYDSAERFRDRPIGLTVRDLTYEIRNALKIPDDAPGVVVSKIEEGTPAAVARIEEGELITRINSDEVVSVEGFEEKINTARQSDAETVKVEIVRLGKTRVADLSLSE